MKMRKDNAKCFWTRSYSLFLTGELVNKNVLHFHRFVNSLPSDETNLIYIVEIDLCPEIEFKKMIPETVMAPYNL